MVNRILVSSALLTVLWSCSSGGPAGPVESARDGTLEDPSGLPLAYRVTARVEPLDHYGFDPPILGLVAEGAIENVGDRTVTVHTGGCALGIELLAADGSGSKVWRSDARHAWPGGELYGCTSHLAVHRIEPGETARPSDLNFATALAEILADSLPEGRYAVDAVLRVSGDAAGPIVVPVEMLELPETYFPLSEGEYPRDGFHYRMDLTENGDAIVATLLVSMNVGRLTLTRTFPAACPLRLLAHRSEADREKIPVPVPDWSWPADCGGDETVSVTLGTDETWTHTLQIPRSALPGGSGRWHVTAIVEPDGRPIRVNAGSVAAD